MTPEGAPCVVFVVSSFIDDPPFLLGFFAYVVFRPCPSVGHFTVVVERHRPRHHPSDMPEGGGAPRPCPVVSVHFTCSALVLRKYMLRDLEVTRR